MGIEPIGRVVGGRVEATDDAWGESVARLELDARFPEEAFAGLDGFSHLEVVYVFHEVRSSDIVTGSRHPRGRADWPRVGIFAQRGRNRPNRIGVSVCHLLRVEGHTVTVQGLDAIDGTPVLDVKPVMREFLPQGEVGQPAWATEIMAKYW